jgi:hypothetical protein
MKVTITIALALCCGSLAAQNLQPVLGYAIQKQTPDWYMAQSSLWHQELEKNWANGLAWYNYYRATRNYMRTSPDERRSHTETSKALAQIVDSAGKYAPKSFEYNLLMWLDHGNDLAFASYLEKAAELDPNRQELVCDMMGLCELRRDIALRDKYSLQWLNSAISSPGLLNYHSNLLNSLDKNAVIFTAGDNDTYPIWQLQAKGQRKDVMSLNVYLLQLQPYQDKILQELGIDPKAMKITDADSLYMEAALMREITRLCKTRPIYVGLTVSEEAREAVEASLTLVGLAYQYSTKKLDAAAIAKRNYEKVFALEYLNQDYVYDISQYSVDCINQNYLVLLFGMYDEYKKTKNQAMLAKTEQYIRKIAEKNDKQADILKMLN